MSERHKLKRECPACRQGPTLVFLTCPSCGLVVLACDEAGCVYADPLKLDDMWSASCDVWMSTTTECPRCRRIQEFSYSTIADILASGRSRDEVLPC